ncbi:DNA polymerase ligase N-terminal domain-containing protein [Methanolacinia petrolearia]|uniref:DNA polymerase ligase N-terminal domain-containing protein n=1 Tax=Methanolacinia petrolearia TaxID=54120 RepID=UPI003BAD1734
MDYPGNDPAGEKAEGLQRFVVHFHRSKTPHYDLRLERHGVLKCWAVPKGIPDHPGLRRLAIGSGDHDPSVLDFSGTITEGQYGAGEISIYDSGIYETESWKDEKIVFVLNGMKFKGRYVLVRFKKAGDEDWLLMKTW